VDVLIDDLLQVSLAEEDEVIEALLAQSAIEALDEGVGVRRMVRRGNATQAHAPEPAIEVAPNTEELAASRTKLAEDPVVVVNQEAIGSIEREEIAELVLDPEERWIRCDGSTQDLPCFDVHDDENVEALKASSVLGENI